MRVVSREIMMILKDLNDSRETRKEELAWLEAHKPVDYKDRKLRTSSELFIIESMIDKILFQFSLEVDECTS